MENKPVIARAVRWNGMTAKGTVRVTEQFCVVKAVVATGLRTFVKTNGIVH